MKLETIIGLLKPLLDKLPFKKWYGQINLYCKENIKISIQFRRGKRAEADPITGFIIETDKKGIKHGPYCPTCWYKSKERIPLVQKSTTNIYFCNVCNVNKFPVNYRQPYNNNNDSGFLTW